MEIFNIINGRDSFKTWMSNFLFYEDGQAKPSTSYNILPTKKKERQRETTERPTTTFTSSS